MVGRTYRVEPTSHEGLCLCDDCLDPQTINPEPEPQIVQAPELRWPSSLPDYAQVGTASGTAIDSRSTEDRKLGADLDVLLRELDRRGRTIDRQKLLTLSPPKGPASKRLRDPELPGGTCTGEYVLVECADGHKRFLPSYCGSHACEYCADGNSMKRGHRVATKNGGRGFARFVVTTPYELRPYIGSDNARQVSKLIYLVIRNFYRHVTASDDSITRPELEIGAVVAMHPCGEDGITYKPHWEFFVPLLGEDNGELVGLEPWISNLDALKSDLALLWGALSESWGTTYRERLQENLYYEYVKAPGRSTDRIGILEHRTGYAFRTFPAWAQGGWAWTVQRLGLAAPRGSADWQEAVNWTPPEQVCPCCGAPMLEKTSVVSYWDGAWGARIAAFFMEKAQGP